MRTILFYLSLSLFLLGFQGCSSKYKKNTTDYINGYSSGCKQGEDDFYHDFNTVKEKKKYRSSLDFKEGWSDGRSDCLSSKENEKREEEQKRKYKYL